jgi:hypothetical protein
MGFVGKQFAGSHIGNIGTIDGDFFWNVSTVGNETLTTLIQIQAQI